MVAKKKWNAELEVSVIPLTGGLGNQLFQYAFGLFLERETGRRTLFDDSVGNPRKINGETSIIGLFQPGNLPRILKKNLRFFSKFYSKAYGWILRNSLSVENGNVLNALFLKRVTALLLVLRIRRPIKVVTATNLGYDSEISCSTSAIFVGYFQTFVYASHPQVFQALKLIEPKTLSNKYFEILQEIQNEKPILLHIRLTDYLKEEQFGIPSIGYYQESIGELIQNEPFTRVWVFSDDIDGARTFLSKLNRSVEILFFEQTTLTDLEVWELMKNFSAYVLSNSTFAWWGAFLRKDERAPVYAPLPWFQGMKDPNMLIPLDWNSRNSI